MAIKMVRKPSETPNINNIDDIIPFRYAYGNQDGYVIGKGTELSHTVNGNVFTVNSGRIVLQGVETDIDANGVSLGIDGSTNELRYYSVYYEVNLATNTVNVLLSNYDVIGYPIIDKGDDLTVNSSGIARLELYRLQVRSGVITNVEKVVKPIQYTGEMTVDNALNINGINLKVNENGILTYGDIIIPQMKLLWKGEVSCIENHREDTSNNYSSLNYSFNVSDIGNVKVGDKLIFRTKFKLYNVGVSCSGREQLLDIKGTMISVRNSNNSEALSFSMFYYPTKFDDIIGISIDFRELSIMPNLASNSDINKIVFSVGIPISSNDKTLTVFENDGYFKITEVYKIID